MFKKIAIAVGLFLPALVLAMADNPANKSEKSGSKASEAKVALALIVRQPQEVAKEKSHVKVKSTQELQDLCSEHGYSLDQIEEVPRVIFSNFPKDLRKIKNVGMKKRLFIKILLPMILEANEEILRERETLLHLRDKKLKGEQLSTPEMKFISDLAEKYKMKNAQDLDEMVNRVDIIPASLALGQASIESGWGLSFAALNKNSPFGITVRDRVLFYQSLKESVVYYMRNLNSHNAYKQMRNTRAQMRRAGKLPDGHTLIGDLLAYSEQRGVYIRKVRTSIRKNQLARYDSMQLANKRPVESMKAQA
ncbi:MAG: glucosaminidase domain-containing protein [Alphaproteobacteria bacterium]